MAHKSQVPGLPYLRQHDNRGVLETHRMCYEFSLGFDPEDELSFVHYLFVRELLLSDDGTRHMRTSSYAYCYRSRDRSSRDCRVFLYGCRPAWVNEFVIREDLICDKTSPI